MLLQNVYICSTWIPIYSIEKEHVEFLKQHSKYYHRSQSLRDQCQHREAKEKPR